MTLSTDALAFNAAASAADAPAALAEPVTPVRKRFIALLTLAHLGLFAGMFGVSGLLLPRQQNWFRRTERKQHLPWPLASAHLWLCWPIR
jgi:hypothetical protein